MRARWILALGLALVVVAAGAYLVRRSNGGLPAATSPAYEETTKSFYRGLAQLQVGLLDDAKREFTKATELAPAEPAAWANLGIAHLRLGEFDAASEPIARAAALLPGASELELLQGRLETSRGRLDEGISHLRRAVELDRGGLRARYALAEEIERAGGANADAEAQQLFEQILERRPDNLAAVLERARVAAKRGDLAALQDSIRRVDAVSASWPAVAVEQYRGLELAVEARNFTDAARAVAFLRNVLVRVTAFRDSLAVVRTPSELIAEPFVRFLKLPNPSSQPSAIDEGLVFSRQPIPSTPGALVLAASLDGAAAPTIVAADGREVRIAVARSVQGREDGAQGPALQTATLPFPGGAAATPPTANGVLAVDWNRDFKMDLALAGRGGVRLLTQVDGAFTDVTAKAGANVAGATAADCFGVWTADVEMDGDLDLIVGVRGAAPDVLRNNGDGTWRQIQPFAGVVGVRAFAWGDLDGDGDPDAALVGERGDVHLFENRQGGLFTETPGPSGLGAVVAIALGDLKGDGALRLVTLDATGAIRRFSQDRVSQSSQGWELQTLGVWPDPIDPGAVGSYHLFLADVDNNGALDLVVSGPGRSRIWLGDESNTLHEMNRARPFQDLQDAEVFGVVDLNGDGQLDMVGVAGGQAVSLIGHGTRSYHWEVMRPRAQPTAGDQRINSFAVGGEIEIRSGLLTQKQLLTGAPVHFGLGTRTMIDVARILWPNGIMQADFDRGADQTVVAEQRLKGSCPWVFTYDGTGMRFVTDFLWRSPLGLRINAQDTAGVTQTEDWVKIRGDQLVARDGVYDVRITAELWETHFVDHVSLMVVDHAADEDVFVDERFARESPALAVHVMKRPSPVVHATDEAGRDVTDLVAKQDGRYLATFARGPYQGVAQDHYVEIELPFDIRGPERTARRRTAETVTEAGQPRHQWLIANGWIYPTDSSINVAIGQAGIAPHGLSLEAQDDKGRWVVVAPDLGFPAGKNKTILVDLERVARAGIAHARRLRLRTNLEIYWDSFAVAEDTGAAAASDIRVRAARAELRYRGFSKTDFGRREVPETPHYSQLANVGQRWRDLVGYYTRYGDVRELIGSVDDRYVIMNAGDELRLSFPAPPNGENVSRDFVLIGDGWVKDGDFNTNFSKTVLPLPRHKYPDYGEAVASQRSAVASQQSSIELEEDPVYRQHARDWQTYHTRFVTPRGFLSGLR